MKTPVHPTIARKYLRFIQNLLLKVNSLIILLNGI